MGKGNFSDDFKRDAVAQITDICFLPCPHPCEGSGPPLEGLPHGDARFHLPNSDILCQASRMRNRTRGEYSC